MLKDRGKFVSCFLSYALGIFGVVAVCARAIADRGFCGTVHLSTPGLGALTSTSAYESYDSYKLARALNKTQFLNEMQFHQLYDSYDLSRSIP